MSDFFGHDEAWRHFSGALASGKLHHGWILAGSRGVGKAHFALRAAAAIVDPGGANAGLIARKAHPDIIVVERLTKDAPKEGEEADNDAELKRSISMDQIRTLQSALTMRPGLSDKRVVIINSADDLERNGANALLKSLEEPPAGTHFMLVSHASDRLLATIRSRCQMLRFEPLNETDMAKAIEAAEPEANAADIAALVRAGAGSPGQALAFLGLDLAELEDAMIRIIETGDPANQMRSELAEKLNLKAAQPRYEAFLRRAPALIAERARSLDAARVAPAIEAWQAASSLANRAVALTLDKQSVVFQMGSLLASLRTHKQTAR